MAFLSGTLVLGDTLRANFDTLFTDANAGTHAVVRSTTVIEADGVGRRLRHLAAPTGQLAVILVAGALAGIRAARLDILQAIASS